MNLLFKKKYLLAFTTISLLYFSFSIYLINFRIILFTILESSTLTQKINILSALIIGSIRMFPIYELLLISTISLLVGANISLILNQLKELRHNGKLKLTTGGASLLALAGSGCAGCGISILSVLGVSTAFIPINALYLQFITITLLIFSLIYNLKELEQVKNCKIP